MTIANQHSVFYKFAQRTIYFRRTVIFATLALTMFLGYHSSRIVIDNSNDSFFSSRDNQVIDYKNFQKAFGSEEYLLVYFEGDGLFSTHSHSLISNISSAMAAFTYEGHPVFTKVLDPFNAPVVRRDDTGLSINALLEQPHPTSAELMEAQTILRAHPIYGKTLTNSDGNAVAVIGTMRVEADEKYLIAATQMVQNLVASTDSGGLKVLVVGGPALKLHLDQTTERDSFVFGLGALLVAMLSLGLLFRNYRQIFGTVLILVLAVIWTIGLMSLAGFQMTLLTVVLPLVVIITGLGSCVHIINYFRTECAKCPRERVSSALARSGRACVFTAITTAMGFLSMLSASVYPMQILGMFGAFGIMICLLLTLTLLPIVLSSGVQVAEQKVSTDTVIDRVLSSIVDVAVMWPKGTTVVCALAAILLSTGMIYLKVESRFVQALHEDHPGRVAIEHVDKHLGGSSALELMLKPSTQENLFDRDFLKGMEKLQISLLDRRQQGVNSIISVESLLKEINFAVFGERVIPDDNASIAQLLLLFEASGGELKEYVDYEEGVARLSIRTKSMSSAETIALEEAIQKEIRQSFAHSSVKVEGVITGIGAIFARLTSYVTQSQVLSFTIASIVICILMMLFLGQIGLGICVMLPNILPIFATYGLMGWLDIPMDWLSATIPSIALGLAVDGTIHIGTYYKQMVADGHDAAVAASKSIKEIGKSLIVTSCALCAGFSVLGFSTLLPLARIGLLLAFCLFVALLADLFMMPALLTWFGARVAQDRGKSLSGLASGTTPLDPEMLGR